MAEERGPDSAEADPDRAQLSTGTAMLDEWLGGGIHAGSVVALVSPPDSPAEELLYPVVDANPGRYLSLLRPPAEVDRHAAALGFDGVEAIPVESSPLLNDPAGSLSGLAPESVVVVDPLTELEREGRDRYLEFLVTLHRAVVTTDSVAVLHCPRMNPRALQRDLTLVRADTVLEVVVQRSTDRGHHGPAGSSPRRRRASAHCPRRRSTSDSGPKAVSARRTTSSSGSVPSAPFFERPASFAV